ncbi:MAG TPA: hypothetical protein VLS93_08635 [Anaeromyxobacteraceae bacterium]|nr:hypothetical protein [Anaeromyxobacteraceae bacterium]
MLFDGMLRSPAFRRALAAGEAQVGRAMGKLLASERFTAGLQVLISSAAQAKETLDRGVRQALRAANLPSAEDVAALKRRLDEVESTLDGLAARLGRGGPDGDGAP